MKKIHHSEGKVVRRKYKYDYLGIRTNYSVPHPAAFPFIGKSLRLYLYLSLFLNGEGKNNHRPGSGHKGTCQNHRIFEIIARCVIEKCIL